MEDAPPLRPSVSVSVGNIPLRQSLDATGAEIRERVERLRQGRARGGGAEAPGGGAGDLVSLPRKNSPPVAAR